MIGFGSVAGQLLMNSANLPDLLKTPVHSKDLILRGIDKSEIEEALGIRGYLEHLKNIGWDEYQWRYYPDDFSVSTAQDERPVRFVEVFGSRYKGYIRGNSRISLLDACKSSLHQAQKFAQCEMQNGHDYEPYQGYSNGLMACKHCGFNGYNTLTGIDRSMISNLESCFRAEKAMRNEMMMHMREWGITLKFDGRFVVDQIVYDAKLANFTEFGHDD